MKPKVGISEGFISVERQNLFSAILAPFLYSMMYSNWQSSLPVNNII